MRFWKQFLMPKSTYTDEQKAEAVARYAVAGPCAVERELGILRGTVTKWAQKAGVVTRANASRRQGIEAARLSWEERRATLTDEIGEVAELAVHRARIELVSGSVRHARDAAATAAVFIDKAQLLSGGSTSRPTIDVNGREEVLDDARHRGLALVPRTG